MTKARVLIEYRGQEQEALIWRGTRAWRQWLTPETTDKMGARNLMMFEAEQIGGVWHIGEPCDPEPGAKAVLMEKLRRGGRILPPRSTGHINLLARNLERRQQG